MPCQATFPGLVRPGCNGRRDASQMPEAGPVGPICLECAAIFGHLPLTIRCRLGDYTRAMMIRRILTICAAVTAGAACASLAQAQSGYPRRAIRFPPARAIPRIRPALLPTIAARPARPISIHCRMRTNRRVRPRCRRPARCCRLTIHAMAARWAPPVYSDRNAPTGPVLSPDDPRYGRPMGAPPSIPIATRRQARCCRLMIRVMAVLLVRRR